jgi:hypothetical protein
LYRADALEAPIHPNTTALEQDDDTVDPEQQLDKQPHDAPRLRRLDRPDLEQLVSLAHVVLRLYSRVAQHGIHNTVHDDRVPVPQLLHGFLGFHASKAAPWVDLCEVRLRQPRGDEVDRVQHNESRMKALGPRTAVPQQKLKDLTGALRAERRVPFPLLRGGTS